MHRVLIADQPVVRRGIRRCVNWNELGVEMAAEALTQAAAYAPDIVLLDINRAADERP